MLEDALKYPFRGEESTKRLVIGGALPFLSAAIYMVGALLTLIVVGFLVMPFALVPRVLLWGYAAVVVAAVLAGHEEPPEFSDWKRIGIDGLRAAAVALVYSIPLLVLAFGVMGVASVTAPMAEQSPAAGPGATMGVVWGFFGLLVGIYALGLYYVLPAAIVNFVHEDDIAAAFHLRTVKDIVVSTDYLVAWLLGAIILLVGGIIALPLYFVLVGFVLRFYTIVVAAYLVTRGSMEAMGWTPPTGPDAPTPGATATGTSGDESSGEPVTADPLGERPGNPDSAQDTGRDNTSANHDATTSPDHDTTTSSDQGSASDRGPTSDPGADVNRDGAK